MKKWRIFLILFLVWSCSGQVKKTPDFASDIITAEGLGESVSGEGLKAATADARKNAMKTALETFSDRELSDENPDKASSLLSNYDFYIKKAKIEKKNVENGQTKVWLKVYFLTEKFISALTRENLLASNRTKIAVFVTFYSSYPASMEKFKEGFTKEVSREFSFYFSTGTFDASDPSLGEFDYALLADVYSYSISPAAEMGMNMVPVVSSGVFKVFQANDLRALASFPVQENAMERNWEKSVSASLAACGASARSSALKAIAQEESKKKPFTVIVSGVSDINTLLKIRGALETIPLSGIYLKSFYEGNAVFSVYAGKMSPEELSSFIIRTNSVRMQIDYLEKAEVKFNMM